MRHARRWSITFSLLVFATLPATAQDGVTLLLEKSGTPGECILDWSGGTSPYRVYRGPGPIGVADTLNLIGETASAPLVDAPPGDAYYLVRSVPTVFRITDLDLMDPHVFVLILIFCSDVTTSQFNPALQDQISGDAEPDGFLDLSACVSFRPLDQGSPGGTADFVFADCTAPEASTVCDLNPNRPPATLTYSNVTMGTCLEPLSGTTTGYAPAIVSPSAPPTCVVTDSTPLFLVISGAVIPLEDVQIAANYDGDPATSLINGLMRGFISEAAADATIVDLGLGLVPLSSLLPGGSGNCAPGDDRDVGPDGETLGWWFYLNFTAEEVPYAGP